MTDQTKAPPREWWLYRSVSDDADTLTAVPVSKSDHDDYPSQVKVIEHSAFKALELERDELKAELVKQSIYREGLIGNLGHAVSTRADCDYSMVVEQNVLAQFIAKERDQLRQLLSECEGVLEKIGSIDHPSLADKTTWIVMFESVCALARETLTKLKD